jgi:hypothetical protein
MERTVMNTRPLSTLLVALTAGALFLPIGDAFAQMRQGPQHGPGGGGHRHSMHDEITMPGLMGLNASQRESDELAIMFRAFETLTRTVDNLPNGIRTATRSSDQEVMGALASHVVGMIDRVERGDDPQIMIQSQTLDIFFVRGDLIETEIDFTDEGIIVIQTSDDPQIVEALQTHAAEVSAMADRGMQAVHEMMMERAR